MANTKKNPRSNVRPTPQEWNAMTKNLIELTRRAVEARERAKASEGEKPIKRA